MNKFIAVTALVAFVGSAQLAMAKGGAAASSSTGGSTANTGTGTGKGVHKLSPKKRLKIQHARIKQGVKNGTISQSEHQQLATEGKAINQERKADLAKDGGKLSATDRHTLETQEDQRSKEIYNDKHPAGSTGSTSSTTGQ